MFFNNLSHKRFNPLTGEWILVSPHRTQRPWQGKIENPSLISNISYDPNCYLCPGNKRASGDINPHYKSTFVFKNDFSALLETDKTYSPFNERDLLVSEIETGICRVICFSPYHNLTLALMEKNEVKEVVRVWKEQYKELINLPDISHVQIFENRGEIMGCSNPHPHGQIWANKSLPFIPYLETINQKKWKEEKKSCLLCDYVELEMTKKERLVYNNTHFAVIVPFWAVWPFETIVLPLFHCSSLSDLTDDSLDSLADVIHKISIIYDNLFQTFFPYSMGIHQSPKGRHDEWHMHIHYFPPLLRSATVKKFMVGYEMLCMPQRDLTPEDVAERLRRLSTEHFSLKKNL